MKSYVEVVYLGGDENEDGSRITERISGAEEQGWTLEEIQVLQPHGGSSKIFNAGVVLHFTRE